MLTLVTQEVNPVVVQAAFYEQYMSFDNIMAMGWYNILWAAGLVFLVLAAKKGKVGVTSIGKNEWGMLEILGQPLIPIPFGFWPFIKGVFHVKQVSTAPTRVNLVSRRVIDDRVLLVIITVWVRVTAPSAGRFVDRVRVLPQTFVQLRRDLIAALYGALDENVNDSENPERISMTLDILEGATRDILKEAPSVDSVTADRLDVACGRTLRTSLGEYIVRVFIREDAPVDGQLWKEGRAQHPLGNDLVDDIPQARHLGIAAPSTA